MADVRYFRVEKDTSLPRAYRAVRDNSGTVYDYETEGIAYDAGSYVASTDIDPRVLERFDDGDEHLNSLLSEVDEAEVNENAAAVKEAAQLVRVPEHSVEAYVLASDVDEAYALLPEDEAVVEVDEEVAEKSREQLEEADAVSDGVDEALSAIDFAAAKGEADKEAGKAQNVTEQAQDGVFEEGSDQAPSAPEEPAPKEKKSTGRASEAKKPDNSEES